MMMLMRWFTSASYVLLIGLSEIAANFDFGTGCEGGSGSFDLLLENSGVRTEIGTIPSGTWNVVVKLSATNDVDVQVYDIQNTTSFAEGQAVVAWCADSSTCNIGILGSDAEEGTSSYAGMHVSYSGYEGVDGQPGKEWISITGELKADLRMEAFAFETGAASVQYEWDRVQTGCCLGTASCGGSFAAAVMEGTTVDIGTIPIGKKDLSVTLESENDVDIQFFDLDDQECADYGGRAIVAYSESEGCGQGILGNNDGTPESTVYEGLTYTYSGYYGGQSEDTYGYESLSVAGVTNRDLIMKAFGYAAGNAIVTYTYWEDYDSSAPTEPSIDWRVIFNHKNHHTDTFKDLPSNTLVVRRGQEFFFIVSSRNGLSSSSINALVTGVVEDSDVEADNNNAASYSDSKIKFDFSQDGDNTVLGSCIPTSDAPIGQYVLTLNIGSYNAILNLIILANPYKSTDVVYTSRANRAEYVENSEGLLWQGLSDNNNAYTWDYAQYEWNNLGVSLNALRRMPIDDRGDMTLVARHLSYSIGADICYGKWGEGSYTSGKPAGGYRCSSTTTIPGNKGACKGPDDWMSTTDLFALHTEVQMPVQYCQCFVYAAIFTSIGRSLGIPTRPVSTFQSAHDTERNRAIDKFYTVADDGTWNPSDVAPSHDSVWSFHVWSEMYFGRPDLNEKCSSMGLSSNCANGWQAVDATPQEESGGGSGVDPSSTHYQMGPASVKLLKLNQDPVCSEDQDVKYGCYDHEFVISEVNADVNLWTKEGESWTLYSAGNPTDPFGDEYNTIGLQISTKKKGPISEACLAEDDSKDCSAELDDISKYYKYTEPSSPGMPTLTGTGPNIDQQTDRGRKLRRLSNGAVPINMSNSILNFSKGLGVNPSVSSVLVNEPHHPASTMTLTLPFTNTASSLVNVTCSFLAWVIDYRGRPHAGNASLNASIISNAIVGPILVESGESSFCSYTITREQYRKFAASYLDSDLQEMDADEKAFAVRMSVITTTSTNTDAFEATHDKMICTPLIGLSTRSGAVRCEGNRGSYHPDNADEEEGGILYHLTSGQRDCSAAANTYTVNDGKCDSSNNIDGCWDGGDCCTFSCYAFNGGLVELDYDTNELAPAHSCFSLNDSMTCLDPLLYDYVPPPDYTQSPTTVAFGGDGGALDDGESICPELITIFESLVFDACTTDKCSSECNAVVASAICKNATLVQLENDCLATLAAESQYFDSCNKPRCPMRTIQGCRCQESWSAYNNDTAVFNNFMCANPDGHTNNWCPIIGGSCDTDNGNPSIIVETYSDGYMTYDGYDGWWDDCGTGQINGITWVDSENTIFGIGSGNNTWTEMSCNTTTGCFSMNQETTTDTVTPTTSSDPTSAIHEFTTPDSVPQISAVASTIETTQSSFTATDYVSNGEVPYSTVFVSVVCYFVTLLL